MYKRQLEDARDCEKAGEIGKEDKECLGCTCKLCIAQQPTDFESGLTKATKIIKKEMVYAKEVNPVMAIGMSQVLMLLNKEIENG